MNLKEKLNTAEHIRSNLGFKYTDSKTFLFLFLVPLSLGSGGDGSWPHGL